MKGSNIGEWHVLLQDYHADLSVGSHVLHQAGDTSQALIEMMTFLKGIGNGLEDLLIFFGMCLLDLLCGADIVLKVADSVLPRSQSLSQELGGLQRRVSHVKLYAPQGKIEAKQIRTSFGSVVGTASSSLMLAS